MELIKYKGFFRSEHISSSGNSEQKAYFCAVPKSNFTCMGDAFPLLFIYCLYDFQEWDKYNTPCGDLDTAELKKILMEVWMPEFLGISQGSTGVGYKFVKEDEFRDNWFTITNRIAELAIQSPIQRIVRYGTVDAWHSYNFLIETQTEYIDFQYWTTA